MIKPILIFCLSSSAGPASASSLSATDAIKIAAKNRPSLLAARIRVAEAELVSRARSAYPPLELGVGVSSRSDIGATDQDLYVSQEIDVFGRTRAEQSRGAATVARARAEFIQSASSLQYDVLTQFAATVAARYQLDLARELVQVAEVAFSYAQRRFEEGSIPEMQLTRASIERDRARQSAEMREAEYVAATQRLAATTGLESGEFSLSTDGMPAILVEPKGDGRPDLVALRAEVQAAESEVRLAKVSSRPELSLQLIRSPWGSRNSTVAGRAQLTWRITDYGQSRNEAASAQLRAAAARHELADASDRATKEIAVVAGEIRARQARIDRFSALLKSARDLVTKAQTAFAEGFGTQMEVLEAIRARREVEEELGQARYQLAVAIADQYRVAGVLVEGLQ